MLEGGPYAFDGMSVLPKVIGHHSEEVTLARSGGADEHNEVLNPADKQETGVHGIGIGRDRGDG